MQDTLLIELRTEELPPKALEQLGLTFGQTIADELAQLHFRQENSVFHVFATPRRLAVQITEVKAIQPDQTITRKGPAVKAGMKDGEPTAALTGFARSCGTETTMLKTMHDGKQDIYYHEFLQKGQMLEEVINDILQNAIKKLPIPKLMRWGNRTHQFVRPVHGLMMLHGNQLLKGEILGLQSQKTTLGHRFLSDGPITLNEAQDYARTLAEQGKVIVSFDARRAIIEKNLNDAANKLNAQMVADQELINEVTALVEWPVILEAGFDAQFLKVPQECLILTMQQNQKYFPLVDVQNKLMNRFLLVSNLEAADPSAIIHGNERVLRARLSDAEFFFNQDKKSTLESRLPKLNQVVYHNKLGTVAQRISRLETIAGDIAAQLNADVSLATRAARLAKADLVTDMVGEFPELQGIMGKYYAQNDQENELIAQAIEEHYKPRFAKDSLPQNDIAIAVALADKLEVLVGIWGIGLIPTGDKDPYALRRAALGILRMLMTKDLNIHQLLKQTFATFADQNLSDTTCVEIYDFMLARLANLLQGEYSIDTINAVLNTKPAALNSINQKLQAVTQFKTLPEALALASANKRVQNVLKKNPHTIGSIEENLLQQAEEKVLFDQIQKLSPLVEQDIAQQNFEQALTRLAALKTPVDAFFDQVMVMSEDMKLRENRLNLLNQLKVLLNGVADIAQLTE
ncbi:glycine--tRNA ligase subunit beta [Neisseria sp. Ec49-e6-T10]|uniref:glycine--tRNA ligase subunit beta n=1 Tax=Neisseria sp. Ec49-e6-T10 TaxID=3140744 RepID=UPI003EBE63D2